MNKLHHRYENNISLTTPIYTENGGRVEEIREERWKTRAQAGVQCPIHGLLCQMTDD